MSDFVLVSGLELIELILASVKSGSGDLVLATDTEVVSLSYANGAIIRAGSASSRGPTFLDMAVRSRTISEEAANAVRGGADPVSELIHTGVLSQAVANKLSCLVAAVDLGRLLLQPLRALAEPAANVEDGEGIHVLEFLKQTIICSGDVGSMLTVARIAPGDTVHRGDAFAAPLGDEKAQRMLVAIEARLPMAVHEVLGLAGDDLTRRKLAATLVVVLATGHLKHGPAAAPRPIEAMPRLSSLTGVMSLDLASVQPAAVVPAWRKESLDTYVARRAAVLNIDAKTPENAASLEREYLAAVVPRGLAAGAAAELVADASRWSALAPDDPGAVVAAARARWTNTQLRADVLETIAKASANFPTVVDVQLVAFDLALEAGAKTHIANARRRFLAVAAKTHPRHAEVLGARRAAAVDIEVGTLVWPAAAVVAVPLITALGLQGHVAEDVGYHPASMPWVLRHGVLLAAAVALVIAGGKAHRTETAAALKRVELLPVLAALIGGAVAQVLLFVLFGTEDRPADFVIGTAVATGIAHAAVERSFFHLAVAPQAPQDPPNVALLALSVVGQVLMVGTYLTLWEAPAKLVMWGGIAAVSVAVPSTMLWVKTRSFWAPLAWQVGMVVLQLLLLRD